MAFTFGIKANYLALGNFNRNKMTAVNLILNLTSLATCMVAGDTYGSILAMLSSLSVVLEMSTKLRTFNPVPLNQHQGEYAIAIYMPVLIS
ncbi:hypothetical protein Q4E40_17190 [Pontibacter sp. BT731]|uniref:hypothetical protein n=1 Tax=Pontibacter coccineus TaxID=3063328 RepID=UPI0026E47026|nr:hypothetical protein [Pontibacter sp. BT731]MDO6391876.1 hypothetical protein [Pontibacter sp. BT731]